MTDTELVDRFLAGDDTSFTALHDRHQNYLRGIVHKMRFRGDIDDIQQEVWLKVWQKAATWRREASFRAWLTAVVMNVVRGEFRKERTRPNIAQKEIAEVMLEDKGAEDPYILLNIKVLDLSNAIQRLPCGYREQLFGAMYGIPSSKKRSTAKSELCRGRKILRTMNVV